MSAYYGVVVSMTCMVFVLSLHRENAHLF